MADLKYTLGKVAFGEGLDLEHATNIKLMLVSTAYVGAATATDSYATASAGEISGTGYTAGGKILGSNVVSADGDNMKFDAANPTWSSSTITAGGALLYDAGSSIPIALFDFAGDKVSSNGDFTVNFNASGLLTIT